MSKLFNRLCLGFGALALPLAVSAAPTSGAYVSDAQNTWVQDRVGDRIGTVNMIMCILGSMRPDALVNQGAYRALVDENKCSGRGDGSKSGSTNAGEANSTKFMAAVVESTQATVSDPLVMKAWITMDGDGADKMKIYVYSVATAGKSDAYPNGLFTVTYCGQRPGAVGDACEMNGVLRSDASGLSFYESELGGGGGPQQTRLALQTPGTDSGMGRLQGNEDGRPYEFSFAYDADHFRRSDGNVDACFARDKALADYSTWRYGTYNADGSRLETPNPGFAVKYVNGDVTHYGYWSFWGLWLPDSALAALGNSGTVTRRVGEQDQALTVVKRGGKLWKQTRQQATLGDFKNISMMHWVPGTVGALQAGVNYELQWNGSKLLALGSQNCDPSGCTQQAFSPVIELSAADFRAAGARMMPIFFPGGGGNGAIVVPASGDFAAGDALNYRTRDLVAPDAADAPTSLVCLNNCLKGDLAAALAAQPPQPFDMHSWAPVLAGAATTYSFGNGMLSRGADAVDGSALARDALGPFGGGLTSGSLVSASDLAELRCDANGAPNAAGQYLCPGQVDQASVSYQWETGPNPWNRYIGAAGVRIDPPKPLAFAANADNIRAADKSKYVGTTLPLQFGGFGELQGIPGQCVDPDTNAAVQCGQNVRWVPAFDIVDGASVSHASSTYYVKFLERELRLGRLSGAAETSCKATLNLGASASLTLPGPASITVNPVTANGAEPTPANPKPSVIDGIVQK